MSKEVGARIRETRQKAGLSQAALAAKTEGVSASVLSKAERGEKELSPEQLQALAAALEIAPEALTGEAAPCECQAAPEAAETPCECRAVPEAAEEPAEMTEEEKEVVQLFQSADAATQNAEFIWYTSPVAGVRENLELDETTDAVMYPDSELLASCEYFTNLPQDILAYYDELWVKLKS